MFDELWGEQYRNPEPDFDTADRMSQSFFAKIHPSNVSDYDPYIDFDLVCPYFS